MRSLWHSFFSDMNVCTPCGQTSACAMSSHNSERGRRSSLAQPQSGRGTPSRAGGRLRHHGIGTAISAFAALHPAGEGRELPGPSDDGSTARVSAVLTLGLDYLPSPLRIARSGLRSRPVRSRPISSVLYTTVRTPVLDSRPTVLDVLARLSEGPRAVHVCTARSRVFKTVQPFLFGCLRNHEVFQASRNLVDRPLSA